MPKKIWSFVIVVLTILVSKTLLGGFSSVWYEINRERANTLPIPVSAPTPRNYDVLLVGYLRGGTTFTGKILGLRQGNFYVYEPFHNTSVWGYYKPGYKCNLKDDHCDKSNTTDQLILDVLRGILHCDKNHLLHSLKIWQVLKGRGYDDDLHNPAWMTYFPECHGEVKGCIEKFVAQCPDSTSQVMKVPRLSVSLAAQLLQSEPNLKIIHLLRDPRAIMVSRYNLKWTPAPGGSLSLCKKMKEDFLDSDKIRNIYPGRMMTVFYEDLVTDPVESARMMYDFAGYDFDESERLRLNKLTGMALDNTQISSNKKTSLQVAMAWRIKMNQSLLDLINQGCHEICDLVGYPPLRNEIDLLNISIPLRISK